MCVCVCVCVCVCGNVAYEFLALKEGVSRFKSCLDSCCSSPPTLSPPSHHPSLSLVTPQPESRVNLHITSTSFLSSRRMSAHYGDKCALCGKNDFLPLKCVVGREEGREGGQGGREGREGGREGKEKEVERVYRDTRSHILPSTILLPLCA